MKPIAPNALLGSHLHLDPHAGIAGDMTVAALVDLGVPEAVVTDAIACLNLAGLKTKFEPRRRGAFMATGFIVTWPDVLPLAKTPGKALLQQQSHPRTSAVREGAADGTRHAHGAHEHRDYAEIKRLLTDAPLSPATRDLALRMFHRLAQVEGARHGVPVDEVTFHEVGAWDSIADIVGVAAAFAYIAPTSVTASPPVLGSGHVKTAHGLIPVPAPATAALLEGIPVISEGQGEMTTPTGAVILATLVTRFTPPPPMTLLANGYGAGTKEFSERPNVLRVMAGKPWEEALPPAATDVVLMAANIDDMSGQMVAPLIDALFAAGAVDAWSTPIFMKKGRPAVEVSALLPREKQLQVQTAFFQHSSTLGLRLTPMNRVVLPRAEAQVHTRWGPVRIKLSSLEGHPHGASPEFDDCQALALQAQVPVKVVYAEAQSLALSELQQRQSESRDLVALPLKGRLHNDP